MKTLPGGVDTDGAFVFVEPDEECGRPSVAPRGDPFLQGARMVELGLSAAGLRRYSAIGTEVQGTKSLFECWKAGG